MVFHAEVGAAVLDEHVELLEGALVEQKLDALARRELALGMLGGHAAFATAGARLGTLALELFENVLHDALVPAVANLLGGSGDGVKSAERPISCWRPAGGSGSRHELGMTAPAARGCLVILAPGSIW